MCDEKRRNGLGAHGDEFLESLLQAQRDVGAANVPRLHARLVLLMANEIGDLATLGELLKGAIDGLATRDASD